MKKIIPFTKDIKFNTKIYELSSISLENTLVVEDNNEIDGEFVVSGEYKMNDSSINTEPFIYGLPFNISLDESYITDTIKIDIDDFKYEIINEEILRVNIDVLVDGKINIVNDEEVVEEVIEPDVIIEARKSVLEDEKLNEYNNLPKVNVINEETNDLFKQDDTVIDVVSTKNKIATSIFENFDDKDEKYISYHIHIIRENDNVDSICKKYNVSIDDLKEYNTLDNITLGNKIIIPFKDNETI